MSPKDIWILAEQHEGKIAEVSYELITRGRELAEQRGSQLCAVVLGDNLGEPELQSLIDRGCHRVIHASAPELRYFLPEPYDHCLRTLIRREEPEVLIAAATSTGRTVMPCVAAALRAGLTADCTGLQIEADSGNLLQTRPAAGGNIMATIKTPERRPQMATVRPHSTRPAAARPDQKGRIDRWQVPAELLKSRIRRVDFEPATESHAIQDAEIVVAVGRGFKKADNVELARRLAEVLGGAVGASREAVDRGWLPYPTQVGLSGKTVSPKLYLAVGVSGTVQHLAGMQTSETIIAINSDSEAPIFNYAEIGLCGDLFTLLPMLTEKIAAAKQS
jgi:electron transfer flavoprotein alpha subunit